MATLERGTKTFSGELLAAPVSQPSHHCSGAVPLPMIFWGKGSPAGWVRLLAFPSGYRLSPEGILGWLVWLGFVFGLFWFVCLRRASLRSLAVLELTVD